MVSASLKLKRVYFGMQCFWGAESTFAKINGVRKTRVGYAGGSTLNPSYTNIGNHTEVVEVQYNDEMCSFVDILDIFFSKHDSTVSHKLQYESAIFYVNEEQRLFAENAIAKERIKQGTTKVVLTRLKMIDVFYQGEDYHQKYWLRCQRKICKELNLTDAQIANSTLTTKINAYLAGYNDNFIELKELEREYSLPENLINYIINISANGGDLRVCH